MTFPLCLHIFTPVVIVLTIQGIIMKKALTIIFIILSAILVLDSMNMWHAFAMFYLAGEIPGTRQSISATTMLEVFALLIGFVISRIGNKAFLSIFDRLSVKLKRA